MLALDRIHRFEFINYFFYFNEFINWDRDLLCALGQIGHKMPLNVA